MCWRQSIACIRCTYKYRARSAVSIQQVSSLQIVCHAGLEAPVCAGVKATLHASSGCRQTGQGQQSPFYICSLYKLCIMQAYRLLHVLASEPRCVRPVDVHTQGKFDSLLARASPLTQSLVQAYRHLYVLASEPRCVRPVDVHTQEPVCVPLTITLKQGQSSALQQPVAGKLLLLYFPCRTGLGKSVEVSRYAYQHQWAPKASLLSTSRAWRGSILWADS